MFEGELFVVVGGEILFSCVCWEIGIEFCFVFYFDLWICSFGLGMEGMFEDVIFVSEVYFVGLFS